MHVQLINYTAAYTSYYFDVIFLIKVFFSFVRSSKEKCQIALSYPQHSFIQELDS